MGISTFTSKEFIFFAGYLRLAMVKSASPYVSNSLKYDDPIRSYTILYTNDIPLSITLQYLRLHDCWLNLYDSSMIFPWYSHDIPIIVNYYPIFLYYHMKTD